MKAVKVVRLVFVCGSETLLIGQFDVPNVDEIVTIEKIRYSVFSLEREYKRTQEDDRPIDETLVVVGLTLVEKAD